MRENRMIILIMIILMIFALSFQSSAQSKKGTEPQVKAVRFLKLYPSLAKLTSSTGFSSRWFLNNASPKLDKSYSYDRHEGILYFINRKGQKIQAFDLKSLGLYGPGHSAWSPDGNMLLCSIFNRNKGGASPLYLLKIDGTIKEIVSAEGARQQILQPSWSYDGKMFVYLKSIRSGSEIWVKNLRLGKDILVERVQIGRGSCGNPVWFNQHQRILYKKAESNRPKRFHKELWIYDLENKNKKRIYEGIITTIFPIISPNDSLIGIDTGKYFSLIDVNGNIVKKFDWGDSIKPSWSPNGLYMAYLRCRVNPVTEISIEQHIHVININTGFDRDLTPVPGLEVDEFRWLNDNTVVY